MKKILIITLLAISLTPDSGYAIRGVDANALGIDSTYYIKDDTDLCAATGGAGPDSVDGHTLPASHGGVGQEEAINENGQVASTGNKVSFSQNASLGQNYRDYYITMRWRYRKWNWNGSNINGPEEVAFYTKAPRVTVTNPRTKKSITAVIMESGPAPWTGADSNPNNTPKQGWTNPQDGTPATYKGRVAGLPPVAFKALGAIQRMADGSGDDLQYSWDEDQKAQPGPTDGSAAVEDDTAATCTSTGQPIVDDGNYAKDTDTMDCPTGDPDIKDGGVDDGYSNGKKYRIRLCKVHGIVVNVLVAERIDKLLDAAEADPSLKGKFTGGGFRTMQGQIDARKANGCPDIYNSPNKACHPPTAKPGYSNHQMGLAIDFSYSGVLIPNHANAGFKWLQDNAANLAGFKNYDDEPWHWSVDGR